MAMWICHPNVQMLSSHSRCIETKQPTNWGRINSWVLIEVSPRQPVTHDWSFSWLSWPVFMDKAFLHFIKAAGPFGRESSPVFRQSSWSIRTKPSKGLVQISCLEQLMAASPYVSSLWQQPTALDQASCWC